MTSPMIFSLAIFVAPPRTFSQDLFLMIKLYIVEIAALVVFVTFVVKELWHTLTQLGTVKRVPSNRGVTKRPRTSATARIQSATSSPHRRRATSASRSRAGL